MWIDDGEKYALIGLQVQLEGVPPPERIAPNLRVLTDTTFDVPLEWREWLGSIRADQVEGGNLFLVSSLKSTTPGVLDSENQSLQQRVRHFYAGLLLSTMFSPSHKPVMLTGARKDGTIGVRQHADLDCPAPQVFRPYPPLVAGDIHLAAQLAQQLDAMRPDTEPVQLPRLMRTMNIYLKTRTTSEIFDRIHQYSRCIEGLILPDIGNTKRQFKSRTELFIGPTHHDLMGELYDIRSNVEHLHENHYLDTFDREVRLDLVAKEAIIEYIARSTLVRIISNDALWPHFGSTTALNVFWSLSQAEQRNIWGDPIDPLEALAEFDSKYLHDGRLGGSSAL